jgi:hypothetical protein
LALDVSILRVMTEAGFCRELAAAEPLAGTANEGVRRWIVVEDSDPWGAKVPRDTRLPVEVREWLEARNAEPHTRVQLIRRPGPERGARRKLFLAETPADPGGRRLIELDPTLDEIPGLDPDALLAAAPPSTELAALWLVCTHGARDRCCAKWGMALWQALHDLEPERTWQSSHLGGHRFAPTALSLPSGLVWGRVDTLRVPELHANLAAGRVGPVELLRGRSAYSRPVQAAECLLRAREGVLGDADLRLIAEQELNLSGARVQFEVRGRGPVEIELGIELSEASPKGCGGPAKARPVWARAKKAAR